MKVSKFIQIIGFFGGWGWEGAFAPPPLWKLAAPPLEYPPLIYLYTQYTKKESSPLINMSKSDFCSMYRQLHTPHRREHIPLQHPPPGIEYSCNITYPSTSLPVYVDTCNCKYLKGFWCMLSFTKLMRLYKYHSTTIVLAPLLNWQSLFLLPPDENPE